MLEGKINILRCPSSTIKREIGLGKITSKTQNSAYTSSSINTSNILKIAVRDFTIYTIYKVMTIQY